MNDLGGAIIFLTLSAMWSFMSDLGNAIIFLVLLALAFACGFGAGSSTERESQHKMAIDAHVGQWTVDATTGATEFRYGPTSEK